MEMSHINVFVDEIKNTCVCLFVCFYINVYVDEIKNNEIQNIPTMVDPQVCVTKWA